MKRILIFAAAVITAAMTAGAQTPQAMTVSIQGFRENSGQVMAFLFNTAEDFPTKRDNAFRSKKMPVTSPLMVISFDDVPSGTYGVAVYHDENSNNKMDRHWYGFPKEGYGASNDAKGTLGPPSFDDAQFKFLRSQDTVKIIIHY